MSVPSITKEHLEGVIVHEFYGNAHQLFGLPDVPSLSLLTICVLVLKNEFTVVGTSACVSPELFNKAVGERIAREKAIAQLWTLEGYLLKDRYTADRHFGQPHYGHE